MQLFGLIDCLGFQFELGYLLCKCFFSLEKYFATIIQNGPA